MPRLAVGMRHARYLFHLPFQRDGLQLLSGRIGIAETQLCREKAASKFTHYQRFTSSGVCLRYVAMTTDRRWKPFSIPQPLLNAIPINSSPLTRLPSEILVEIFNHVGLIDQLVLAFTCKHLLQVSTLVSLKMSNFVGARLAEGSKQSSIMENLLKRVKPLTAAGRPKKGWQICVDCLRYRPVRMSYWKKKRRTGPITWDGWVVHWNDGYSLQCPECKYLEAMPWITHMEATGREVK